MSTGEPDEPFPHPRDGADFEVQARTFIAARVPPSRTLAGFGAGNDGIPSLSDPTAEEQARRIAAARDWQRTMFDHGYGWIEGPPAYGGAGLGADEAKSFRRIEADFELPDRGPLLVGLGIVAPAIIAHGTPEQKADLLPRLFRGDLFASLLLSEPGTGSDLGAMTTKAVRDGDEWQVDGQKGWGSYAHFSDVSLLLVRTSPDAPKEQGLTTFVIDMHQPGVEVRPVRQMTGGAHFADVFLTAARVPDSRRLGAAGDGWRVATTALLSERGAVSSGQDDPPSELLRRLSELWAHTEASRSTMAGHRGAVTSAAVLSRVVQLTTDRLMPTSAGRPGLETSITKLLRNQFLAVAVDSGCAIAGPAATADDHRWGRYAWGRARVALPGARIAGGSDEIQRNILAERVLGLPREPRVAPRAAQDPGPDKPA